MKLFRRLILRPLRRDLARTALTLLSIALGVAVVIAIDLAGDAATGSFQSSMTTLVGKIDYEITANGGIDEQYVGKLTALPLNARFSPMIEQPVVIPGHGSTILYGIDIIANAPAGAAPAGDGDPETGPSGQLDPAGGVLEGRDPGIWIELVPREPVDRRLLEVEGHEELAFRDLLAAAQDGLDRCPP